MVEFRILVFEDWDADFFRRLREDVSEGVLSLRKCTVLLLAFRTTPM